MAGEGARKRIEGNARIVNRLGIYIVVCAAVYAIVRLGLKSKTADWSSWAGLAVTMAVQGFCYIGISVKARPIYENGVLADGGADLSKGSITYYFDMCYVTGFVQVLASFTRWGWYVYLLVPAFGLYFAATKALPLYQAYQQLRQQGAEVDPSTKKRLDRTQGRADRRRVKRI